MIAFRPPTMPMIEFQVNDMTCGRSAGVVTKAVKAADHGAKVRINMAMRRVEIEPSRADADELRDAINKAGCAPEACGNSVPGALPGSGGHGRPGAEAGGPRRSAAHASQCASKRGNLSPNT